MKQPSWLFSDRGEHGIYPVRENGIYPVRENGIHPVKEHEIHPARENGIHPVKEHGIHSAREYGIHPIKEHEIHPAQENNLHNLTLAEAKGIFTFSPQAITQLENIINQCPLAGGRAVYQARALYSLVNDTVYLNDSLSCAQIGLSWKQIRPSSQNDIRLMPNPSSAVTKVVWDNRLYKIASIEVYSLLGIQHYKTIVKENKGEVEINIASLPQGFHVFKLLDEYGNVIKSLKFIKE